MRITDITESTILTLERFKSFANIVDWVHDSELNTILVTAALRIAQYADVALLECTIVDDVEGATEAQLWMPPVASVTEVVDRATGVNVAGYCSVVGNRLMLPDVAAYTVTYRVVPDDATVDSFAPAVWQMAVAIWDGNTEEELKAYQRIPSGYVVH